MLPLEGAFDYRSKCHVVHPVDLLGIVSVAVSLEDGEHLLGFFEDLPHRRSALEAVVAADVQARIDEYDRRFLRCGEIIAKALVL